MKKHTPRLKFPEGVTVEDVLKQCLKTPPPPPDRGRSRLDVIGVKGCKATIETTSGPMIFDVDK